MACCTLHACCCCCFFIFIFIFIFFIFFFLFIIIFFLIIIIFIFFLIIIIFFFLMRRCSMCWPLLVLVLQQVLAMVIINVMWLLFMLVLNGAVAQHLRLLGTNPLGVMFIFTYGALFVLQFLTMLVRISFFRVNPAFGMHGSDGVSRSSPNKANSRYAAAATS